MVMNAKAVIGLAILVTAPIITTVLIVTPL